VSLKLTLIQPSGQPGITNRAEILLTVSLYVKRRLDHVKDESNDFHYYYFSYSSSLVRTTQTIHSYRIVTHSGCSTINKLVTIVKNIHPELCSHETFSTLVILSVTVSTGPVSGATIPCEVSAAGTVGYPITARAPNILDPTLTLVLPSRTASS